MDLVLKSVPNGPIAKVNDTSIPRAEFIDLYLSELQAQQRMAGKALSEVDRVRLGIHALGTVIEREILRQEAQRRNLSVSDADVEEVWKQTLEMARKSRPGSQEIGESQVLEAAGATREEAFAELREALLVEKAREAIAKENGVNVTEAEITSRYQEDREKLRRPDQLHLKQIYISVPPGDTDAAKAEREKARERAENVLKRLQQGQTFEALARRESDGRFKESEGDLGPVPVNQLPPFIVSAAEQLEPGEVSGVVESPVGFHIVKLVESIPGEEPSFEKVQDFLRKEILEEKGGTAVREFVQEQMEAGAYNVETFLDLDTQLRYRPELQEQLNLE